MDEGTASNCTVVDKIPNEDERGLLDKQNNRLVSEFKANKLEIDAKKNWDLFYKRNDTRFFKDRHWTTREFHELTEFDSIADKALLEVGCGVGNLIYPLLDERPGLKIYACDISSVAVDLIRAHAKYDANVIEVFQSDITVDDLSAHVPLNGVDVISMVFVLSAIHPDKYVFALKNLYRVLKPGGIVIFRDYGLYDMTQLRFKPGNKISDNFYVRQDGTRSYFFSVDLVDEMFTLCGYIKNVNCYVHRRTVNKKENIDVPRIFVQAKYIKPLDTS